MSTDDVPLDLELKRFEERLESHPDDWLADAVDDIRQAVDRVSELEAQCAALTELYQRARDSLEGSNNAAGPYEMQAAMFEQKYPRLSSLPQIGKAMLERHEAQIASAGREIDHWTHDWRTATERAEKAEAEAERQKRHNALQTDSLRQVNERLKQVKHAAEKAERERDGNAAMFVKEASRAHADGVELGRIDMRERAAKVAEAQPFYPDTHTGMRQQWVKDQIAAAIRALPLEPEGT